MNYDFVFRSRRSNVLSRNGLVATSQPLAAQAGLSILQAGGNAADAAIATAAALNVVEPMSTGIGGDCFALYWDAKSERVTALNGSGRSAAAASIDELRRLGYARMPQFTGHSVSIPGNRRRVERSAGKTRRHDAGRCAEAGHPPRRRGLPRH